MKILVVNGQPRSGKDLFCEAAQNNCSLIYPISTIDRVKQVALFAGWSGEKDAKSRRFLSDLKDAMTRYNNMPHDYVLMYIKNRSHLLDQLDMVGYDNAVFLVQAREPEDIQRFVDENNARTLFISREETAQNWGNHADDNAWDFNYDYYLENNGTIEEWEEESVKFINMIRRESWESRI